MPALPTLDERVDLFLRAVHGKGRKYTTQQRLNARRRILDAMVADLVGEVNDPANEGGVRAAAASRRIACLAPPISGKASSLRRTLRAIGDGLRDAL